MINAEDFSKALAVNSLTLLPNIEFQKPAENKLFAFVPIFRRYYS